MHGKKYTQMFTDKCHVTPYQYLEFSVNSSAATVNVNEVASCAISPNRCLLSKFSSNVLRQIIMLNNFFNEKRKKSVSMEAFE